MKIGAIASGGLIASFFAVEALGFGSATYEIFLLAVLFAFLAILPVPPVLLRRSRSCPPRVERDVLFVAIFIGLRGGRIGRHMAFDRLAVRS